MKIANALVSLGLALCLLAQPAGVLAQSVAGSPLANPTGGASAGAAVQVFGDSLTAGNQDGSGVTLPNSLQALLGVPVVNGGIGSQLSTQIMARQGGVAITLTLSGNSIPSANNSASVTTINGVALAGTSTGQSPDYRLLSSSGSNYSNALAGTLCGVHGRLVRTASGGPPSTTETYKFFPDVFLSAAVACSANSTFTPDTTKAAYQGQVFWPGRNNFSASSVVQADLATGVALLGHSRYLVMGVINGEYSSEVSGQSGYNQIVALNAAEAATYGSHFWDVRSWLVSQYNAGNPVDVLDHANDIPPYTLRATVGSGALNGAIGDTSTCAINLTQSSGAVAAQQVLKVDSEYILVTTAAGSAISACTRGFGTGGVAATHSSGAAYTLVDPIHLSGAADALIAAYINTNFKALLTGAGAGVAVTPYSVGDLMARPLRLVAPLSIGQAGADLDGPVRFSSAAAPSAGSPLILFPDNNGNMMHALTWAGGAQVNVGGNNVGTVCLTPNGTSSLCASNSGDVTVSTWVSATYYKSSISSQAGTSYTVAAADSSVTFTNAGTVTVTLPAASSSTGRLLRLRATGGGAVNSASSNVVPLAGGAAGTAILSASAGKFAELQSDGSNWIVMEAN